jgi:hypothetical protein
VMMQGLGPALSRNWCEADAKSTDPAPFTLLSSTLEGEGREE